MTTMRKIPVRIAMREEGEWWNAYLAHGDTMKDAKLIGSILFGAVANNPERRERFLQLMTEILLDAIEGVTGERPAVERRSPPEHERSGR